MSGFTPSTFSDCRIGVETDLHHFDLSLSHRRETRNQVVLEAAEALRETGFGIKAATITPEGPDDVGSPNAVPFSGVAPS
jgi:isocitrate dehydrogenase